MIDTDELMEILAKHCLVGNFDTLRRGHIRIGTKLSMLDGSGIDVFLEAGPLTRDVGYALSDFGQTLETLSEFGVRYKDRAELIQQAIYNSGVKLMGDRLVLELTSPADFSDGVVTLAQACLRVSCVAYTKKSPRPREFSVQVRNVLESTGLSIEPNFRYSGPYNQEVKVDYRVTKTLKPSAILRLGHTHTQANEVFRKWADLRDAGVEDRFITIYDDTRRPDNPADLSRINKLAAVVPVSNRQMISGLLTKAA